MPSLDKLASKTKVADELWLTTRRAGGVTATYPLWFVHDGQRLYILSAESSSEVWDVRGNPRVEVTIGAPDSSDRLAMHADVMAEASWVPMMVDLLQKKYGARCQERMARIADVAKTGHVIIKLKPV